MGFGKRIGEDGEKDRALLGAGENWDTDEERGGMEEEDTEMVD